MTTGITSSAPLAGVQRELLGAHFLLLTRLLRKSARVDYARFEPHNLMERRIVLTLYRIEEGRVSELAGLLGNDVAQVSRALSAMRETQLVRRERQRDPYQLTAAGRQLGQLLDTVALRRDRELTTGLSPQEMFEFAGLLGNLLEKATVILAEEVAKARDSSDPELGPAAGSGLREIHGRAHPAIINLSMTIARGASLAFKRLAGLSNYEWRILANIASRPSLPFMELVTHIDSDKAQVSRALDSMVQNEVLRRERGLGGEPVRFDLTAEGRRLHDVMQSDALRRNALLTADLKKGQRRRLQAYLDLLITNAAAMAGRED